MSWKLRAPIGALIVCLIVVPAVVRATRTFDPGSRPRLAPSFNKSFDVPPEVADVTPDGAAAPILHAVGPAPSVAAVTPAAEHPHLADLLRGPPALRRF